MKKLLFILLAIFFLFMFYRIFIFHRLTTEKTTLIDEGKYALYKFSLPKSIAFAGEKIPLEDSQVRDRMVHFLIQNTHSKTQTLMLHKLSARWFPVIEKILKKNGIPEDFKYLALVESGFGNDVSVKGASGFWQFLPLTAMQYGLEINSQVDERQDPEKATVAACKYLKDCYKIFNNWTLAAASYNMGPVALKEMMKSQHEKSYYDLILNKETSAYIFKILAMKEIITRPRFYGYNINRKQLFSQIPAKNVVIDSGITNLSAFATYHQTTVPLIKIMNPWLIGDTLTNSQRKKYTFKILRRGFENLPGLKITTDSITGNDTSLRFQDSIRGI